MDGTIPVKAIDELFIENPIGVVKIDVEGFELNVINGMQKTIATFNPYIVVEIRHVLFEEINGILNGLGYNYIEIEPHIEWRDYNNYLFYKQP